MDACSYIIAIPIISIIKYTPLAERKKTEATVMQRLKVGLNYLKNHPLLFYFGILSYSVFIFVIISNHVLWPVYIDQHLNASGDVYAITKIFYAGGALLAGFSISWIFRKRNAVFAIIALMVVALTAFVVLSITKAIYLLLIFSFALGISNAGIRIQRITYLFNHIPNYVIGRVNSVFQSINVLFRSVFLSLFSLQFFNENANVKWTFIIAAGIIFISILPLTFHYNKLKNLKIS